jgi:hypothetical protein
MSLGGLEEPLYLPRWSPIGDKPQTEAAPWHGVFTPCNHAQPHRILAR